MPHYLGFPLGMLNQFTYFINFIANIYLTMKSNAEKEIKEIWSVRCSQGHEFFTDYLPEIVNETTGEYECTKCLKEQKTSCITLTSEECLKGRCLSCPDNGFMECSCACHDDFEYVLQLTAQFERELMRNEYK